MSLGIDGFLSARISVKNVLLLIFLAAAWPAIFHLFGLYQARRLRHLGAETKRLVLATTAASGLGVVFPLTSMTGNVTLRHLPYFWLSAVALACWCASAGEWSSERATVMSGAPSSSGPGAWHGMSTAISAPIDLTATRWSASSTHRRPTGIASSTRFRTGRSARLTSSSSC